MPNWKQPYDIFNNTGDNFNPHNIHSIKEEYILRTFPKLGECPVCKLDKENPPKPCYKSSICRSRLKDYEENANVVITKGGPGCITIRTGNLLWLYDRKINDLIFRACKENETTLHHKYFDPFDNRGDKVVIIDNHSKFHGELVRIQNELLQLQILELNLKGDSKRKVEQLRIKKAKEYQDKMENIRDSERVFEIIDIMRDVINGRRDIDNAQKKLEKLHAAYPLGMKEVDMRKSKTKNQQLYQLKSEITKYDLPVSMFPKRI